MAGKEAKQTAFGKGQYLSGQFTDIHEYYYNFCKMESKIIKIGNSKGIIIPNEFLKLLHFEDQVTLYIEKEKLVIKPVKKKSRENWKNIIKEEIAKCESNTKFSNLQSTNLKKAR